MNGRQRNVCGSPVKEAIRVRPLRLYHLCAKALFQHRGMSSSENNQLQFLIDCTLKPIFVAVQESVWHIPDVTLGTLGAPNPADLRVYVIHLKSVLADSLLNVCNSLFISPLCPYEFLLRSIVMNILRFTYEWSIQPNCHPDDHGIVGFTSEGSLRSPMRLRTLLATSIFGQS